jgi:hypothetical protein
MPYDTGTGQLVNQLTNPPNPFDQYGKTLQFADQYKQFQANKAISDIYGQSIDPQTGQVDLGKFNALAQQNPAALWKFGAQMQQAGQGLQAEGAGTSADLGAKRQALESIGTQMAPLVAQIQAGGDVTKEQAQQALEQAKGLGLPASTIANVQRQLDALPSGASARNIVLGANFANTTGMQILSATAPGTTPLETGGGTQFVAPGTLSPARNVGPGAYVPHTLTPGENIQTIAVPIGNNQQATVPQAVAAQGANAVEQWLLQNYPGQYRPGSYQPRQAPLAPAPAPAPAPATPSPSGKGATATGPGRYPQPSAPAPAPATPTPTPAPAPATPAPASPTTPAAEKPAWLQPPSPPSVAPEMGGPLVTPTPQQAQSAGEITGAASKNAAGLATQRAQTPDQIAILDDMNRVLNQPGVVTGVGAQQVSKLRQVAMNMGLVPSEPGQKVDLSTPEAAQAELTKDSALLARAGLGAMGNPTDARQELITESTPGPGLSKEGNLNIIRMLKGNAQAIQTMDDAWNKAKNTGQWVAGGSEQNNFNTWRDNRFLATDPTTGGRFDPTVFWLANQPDVAAQKKYIANLPPEAQQQVVKNLSYASKMGWIKKRDDASAQVVAP